MSDNLLLTLLGTVGIGALIMGLQNKEENKEKFTNVGLKSVMQTVAGGQSKSAIRGEPMKNTVSSTVHNMPASRLGSSASTNQPFVSIPTYQQSTPLRSPSIALPPMAKYKPTTRSNMGITEAYNPKQFAEGYMDMPANNSQGFMGMKTDIANPNPRTNFSAGNYKQASFQQPCIDPQGIDGVQVGTTDMLSASGEPQQVMMFDRPMTTLLKPGRTSRTAGDVDRIRGDIIVCPQPNNYNNWFRAPAGPTDLTVGALQFLGGESATTTNLANFMKSYGSTSSNVTSNMHTDVQVGMNNMTVGQSQAGSTSIVGFF